MSTEIRQLQMHSKLLYDVILRQAGSLSKAILEGIMNSVDAGAKKCDIQITQESVTIVDDGRGFRNRDEIVKFFEVFGQPHETSEGKTYGTFRMGRGQLFAFGLNQWNTGGFHMEVDIKRNGLQYKLRKDNAHTNGCFIAVELYEHLLPSDLADTVRTVARMAKWCPIPVIINGEDISQDPKKAKWDHVTEDAFVTLKKSDTLSIYNLGIHVFDLPSYRYGTGGMVVTRNQLKVNFARNDVQSDCPVWKKIAKMINRTATDSNMEFSGLHEGSRRRLAVQWRRGEVSIEQMKEAPLFTAVTGRHFSLKSLRWNARQITVTERGDRRGDTIHRGGSVFVLAIETLERFECKTLQELVEWIHVALEDHPLCYGLKDYFHIVDFDILAKQLGNEYSLIATKDMTINEKIWLRIAKNAASWMIRTWNPEPKERSLHIGISSTGAYGWTNGSNYIAINREFVKQLDFDVRSFVRLGQLILHEYCHNNEDASSHGHDQAFYEIYHDSEHAIPEFVGRCLLEAPKALSAFNRKATGTFLKMQDRLELKKRAENSMKESLEKIQESPPNKKQQSKKAI